MSAKKAAVSALPKGETGPVLVYYPRPEELPDKRYAVTRNDAGMVYTMWEVVPGGYVKISSNKDPRVLTDKADKLCGSDT